MKRVFLLAILATLSLASCSLKENKAKKELYAETDYFVESLATTYRSYGIRGFEDKKTAGEGLYTITPIGRLINVKIEKAVDDKEYEDLKNDLKDHYKGNYRVNDVYICKAGTVMIDCRN